MPKSCLIYLSLLFASSAFSKDEDKGYAGIPWGEDYKISMRKLPARNLLPQDCSSHFKQFDPKSHRRKYIDQKNIFPGLCLTNGQEIPERNNSKINQRYKVIQGLGKCLVFFDDKFVGTFNQEESTSSYDSELSSISMWYGPSLETHSDCEEKCVDRYRVYFHNKGDTNVLKIVTPFKQIQLFIYSKHIMKEIEKAVNEARNGK